MLGSGLDDLECQVTAARCEGVGPERARVSAAEHASFRGKVLGGSNLVDAGDTDRTEGTEGMAVPGTKESSSPHSRRVEIVQKLAPDTQKLLRAEMPGWPGIRETPYKHGSLPELLYSHRNAHTYWRYIHEEHWGVFRSAELDRALTVIINAYGKRWGDSP